MTLNFQDESSPSISQFTSPYVVKMRKERETRRLEEVDLDTGRRRSWVESTEHDVIDLTGETPTKKEFYVKPRTPLSSLGVNSRTSAMDKRPLKSPLPFLSATPMKRRDLRSDALRRHVDVSSDLTTMQSGTRRRPSLRN